jgi:hypothetical protein
MARIPTAKKYKSWLVPAAVLKRAEAAKGGSASVMLMDYLKGGQLSAFSSSWARSEGDGPTHTDRGISVIAPSAWNDLQNWNFWNDGYAKFEWYSPFGTVVVYHYDIRFDPVEIDKIFPVPDPTIVAMTGTFGGTSTKQKVPSRPTGLIATVVPDPLPPATAPKHAGGKPPKEIWEAVWVDMAAALINGKFDPRRLTDVQNFILDWCAASNEPMSESTAKRHAKLLWDQVKLGS